MICEIGDTLQDTRNGAQYLIRDIEKRDELMLPARVEPLQKNDNTRIINLLSPDLQLFFNLIKGK